MEEGQSSMEGWRGAWTDGRSEEGRAIGRMGGAGGIKERLTGREGEKKGEE